MSRWITFILPFAAIALWGAVLYGLWHKDPLFGLCFMLGWIALGSANYVVEKCRNV